MKWHRYLWVLAGVAAFVSCTAVANDRLADKPSQGGGDLAGGAGGEAATPGKALGVSCDENDDCASGNCADEVCCDRPCSGPCVICDLLGVEGTCTPHPAGTDPDGDCQNNQRCSSDGMCVTPGGMSCQSNAACDSGFCRDGVCCDQACDDICESCAMVDTGVADGFCAPHLAETDPEDECPGEPGTCVTSGACCGDAVAPAGGNCPSVCESCNGDVCTIACTTATCEGNTVNCPPDFACVVDCSREGDACRDAIIDCPSDYACTTLCGESNHKCQRARINCGNGPCVVECVGGDTCDSAIVNCGPNSCDVTCAGAGKPGVSCGDACSCPNDCD